MSDELHHVSRIENERQAGWYVRIQRQGEIESKWFSDKSRGGRDASKAAATRWRDRVLETVGAPKEPDRAADSPLGVVGLRIDRSTGTPRVQVARHRDGDRQATSFSGAKDLHKALWQGCLTLARWRGDDVKAARQMYVRAIRRL